MVATNSRDRLILWIAQGFGAGRAPVAPGTFGTLVGVGWFAVLLGPESLWIYFIGTFAGILASVWLCGEAERILGQHDPGSVVIDEIVAMPVAMAGLVIASHPGTHETSAFTRFFMEAPGLLVVGFILFRAFDIWKPWPVKQSQSLPGGWGVTMDDVLAAVYVNLAMLLLAILALVFLLNSGWEGD